MDTSIQFNSVEEECCHWKDQARKYYQECLDVQQELEDFTEGSRQLEAELETSLEQREKTIKDLKTNLHQLQIDNETLRKRIANCDADYTKLDQCYAETKLEKERLKTYTRELEQINDDLERAYRVLSENVSGAEAMLNQAYEKNALLEMEVDEKEALQVKLQRLMDEARDLKQELNIRTNLPDSRPNNATSTDKLLTISADNKSLVECETQTIGAQTVVAPAALETTNNSVVNHPIKHTENVLNGNAMTASSRLSALNLVAELLRKVNLDHLLCSKCDKFRCVCPQPLLIRPESLPPLQTATTTTLFKRLSQKMGGNNGNIVTTTTLSSTASATPSAMSQSSSSTTIQSSSCCSNCDNCLNQVEENPRLYSSSSSSVPSSLSSLTTASFKNSFTSLFNNNKPNNQTNSTTERNN